MISRSSSGVRTMGLAFMLLALAAFSTSVGDIGFAHAIGAQGRDLEPAAEVRHPADAVRGGGLRAAGEQARDLFIAAQGRAFGLAGGAGRAR